MKKLSGFLSPTGGGSKVKPMEDNPKKLKKDISAGDDNFDLSDVKDDSMVSSVGEDDDYVPPDSIAKLVAQVEATLDNEEESVRQHLHDDSKLEQADSAMTEASSSATPTEDEQDRLLKQQFLQKFKQGQRILLSPTESDYAATPDQNPAAPDMTYSQAKRMALGSTEKATPKTKTPKKTPKMSISSSPAIMEPLNEAFEVEMAASMEESPGVKEAKETDSPTSKAAAAVNDSRKLRAAAQQRRMAEQKQAEEARKNAEDERRADDEARKVQIASKAEKQAEEEAHDATEKTTLEEDPAAFLPTTDTVTDEDFLPNVVPAKQSEKPRSTNVTTRKRPVSRKPVDRLSTKQAAASQRNPPSSSSRSSQLTSRLTMTTASSRAHQSPPTKKAPPPSPRKRTTGPTPTALPPARKRPGAPPPVTTSTSRLTSPTASSRAHASPPIKRVPPPPPQPRKQAGPPASMTSRLLTPTASSRAHASPPAKTMAAPPKRQPRKQTGPLASSRLTQSTASTRAHTSPPVKKPVVQRNKLEARNTNTATNQVALTEAQKRARERVRQHRLKQVKAAPAAGGKENVAAKPRTVPTDRKRRLTVGRSPPLNTRAKHGSRRYSSSGDHSGAALDVNPITAATSPTHGFAPSSNVPTTKPKPTVVQPFHLSSSSSSSSSTHARSSCMTLGESMQKLTRSGFGKLDTPTAPVRRSVGLTIPKPPRLSEGHKRALPKSTAEKEEEEMEYFRTHPFRAMPRLPDSFPGARGVPKVPKRRLTTPEPFRLRSEARSASAKKQLKPSPRQQEDARECQKQFHARPMPAFKPPPPGSATRVKQSPARVVSDDEECKKQFQARPMPAFKPPPNPTGRTPPKIASTVKKPPPPPRPEEGNKPFHARPMPDFQPPPIRTAGQSKATTPQPFKLSQSPARTKPKTPGDDEEVKKQFHARPVPRSNFVKPPPPKRSPVPTLASGTPLSSLPGPPKLSTCTRSDKREAAMEASRKKAEALSAQRKKAALQRQQEKHLEEMEHFKQNQSPLRVTSPQPFQLLSEKRHEVYAQKLEAQIKLEQQEEKRRTEFRASRFHASPPPPPPRPRQKRASTEPKPFKLRTNVRHEHNQRVMEEKLEQESKTSTTTRFKANPVPKTTYHPVKSISPKSEKPLVNPISPHLESTRRAKQRQEFDELAQEQRELAEAKQKLQQERRKMEEELELEQQRRLPASEGGFNPTIQPINAVFDKPTKKQRNFGAQRFSPNVSVEESSLREKRLEGEQNDVSGLAPPRGK